MINRNKIRKQFQTIICFIAFFIIMLEFININVKAADTETLSTVITYGFHGTTRMDCHTPFTISISNKDSEINGKVQMILSSLSESNTATDPLLNNRYSEKNYMYEKSAVIAANTTTDISMVIPLMNKLNKIKINIFDEYGNILSSKEQEIESEYLSYYVYTAIFCDEPSVLNYFQNTALYQYNDFTFKAIPLSKNDIPSENYGLELFDVIIVSQNQLNSLSKEQRNVIYNWQKNGGFLIKSNEITNKQNISWESVIPDEELKQLDNSYRSYENWSITYALSNVFMNGLPNFTVYVVVIAVYILLMGPFLYLILKKLNKRKLFWLCEIGGSVLFTIIVIALGSSTRLKAPFINYFNIVSYNENTIDDSVYFNIRAPFNNDYKLYLDKDYSFQPIYDTVYIDDVKLYKNVNDYNIGISHNELESTIAIKNDPAFTKENFYAEKLEEKNGKEYINVNMNTFGNKVTGTVTNNLDYPIDNAAILEYNKVIFLDTLPANSTIDLQDKQIFTYNPKFKYGLTNQIAGLKMNKNGTIEAGYILQNQKKTILDFYLEKNFGVNTNKAYLVGFATDRNKFELQLDSAYDAYGITMIEVPIDVDYTADSLIYTAYVPIKNEEYSSSGDIMYSDEMILTYNLGQNLTDINLYFNELSYYDEEYYKTFSGHIYFYNRETTLYDPIDITDIFISNEELKPYLNEENEVVIKYVEHFDEEEKQALLPSLSTIGRVNDAEN